MKRKYLWVIIYLLLGGLLFGFFALGGLFFSAFPKSYPYVSGALDHMGYNLACYDLHGGWRCSISKKKPPLLISGGIDAFTCHRDAECLVTPQKGCVNKAMTGLTRGATPNDGQCQCMQGPVIFGCVLTNSPLAHQ